LRQPLSARFTRFSTAAGAIALACVLVSVAAGDAAGSDIQLELRPRICTLATGDKQCELRVYAKWRSPREESLCLVIVDRPEVKRCWENYAEGTYSIELVFADDVIFQLRDLQLQHVLASEALRVIKEAIRYRHKRRQPWNIFD
jgi:Protein of unknown function (DUF3019)